MEQCLKNGRTIQINSCKEGAIRALKTGWFNAKMSHLKTQGRVVPEEVRDDITKHADDQQPEGHSEVSEANPTD